MVTSELESTLRVVEDVSRPNETMLATIAGELTIYFTDVARAASALSRVYERALDMMGTRATYVLAGWHSTRPRRFRAADRNLIAQWASAPETYAVSVRSGADKETYGPWSFSLHLTPSVSLFAPASTPSPLDKANASYLYMTVPLSMLIPDPRPLRDLAFEFASSLPVRSGHAGLGFAYNDSRRLLRRDQQLAAWNKRFRGIDVGDAQVSAPFVQDRIQGVNWLTLLDSDFVTRIGGRSALGALGPDVKIHSLPTCFALQAGSAPRLGDINELEDMAPYIKVNNLIKPIRAEGMYPPSGFLTREEAIAWLCRFDER